VEKKVQKPKETDDEQKTESSSGYPYSDEPEQIKDETSTTLEKKTKMEKQKDEFMDNILQTTMGRDKNKSLKKLNSYEKQQKEEMEVWSQIAREGVDKLMGDDGADSKPKKPENSIS